MGQVTRDTVMELAAPRQGPCISLFMPTERAGREVMAGPIRFKNLLDDAEEQLIAAGMRRPDAHELLAPAWRLHADSLFWQHQDEGLAVFVASDFLAEHRLPYDVAEQVLVGDAFHIKPLLPLLTGDGRFYVLTLSKGDVRLLAGNREGLEEVEVPDVPKNIEEALQYDDPERQQQFHTQTSNPATSDIRSGQFFGTGAAADDDRDEVIRFLHQVEADITRYLRDERVPLVLVGLEETLPYYRRTNDYRYLLDEAVTDNPKLIAPEDLHRRVWELVEPHFTDDERAAREAYAIQAGRGNPMAKLGPVLNAAHEGRVDTLFVPLGVTRWGHYDPERRRTEVHAAYQPGDQDLLDLAAIATLRSAGTVFAVPAEALPGDGDLAAVVRY